MTSSRPRPGPAHSDPATARNLADRLAALKQAIKEHRREKQETARAFGDAKAAGDDLAPLKARMQTITATLKTLEDERRQLEKALGESTSTQAEEAKQAPAPLPPRFTVAPGTNAIPPGLTISHLTDTDEPAWDAYVAHHPRASLYHFSRWRHVIRESFRQRDLSLLGRDSAGAIVGVLPLARLTSRLFGDFAVSMPYFNYGGALGDSEAIEEALMHRAGDLAAELGLDHVEFRDTRPRDGWPAREDKVSMIRALPESPEALDRELGAKLRAQIRRARREGPVLRSGRDDGLLDDFYRVFARNMRDLGTPVYAKAFFRNVLEAWPQSSELMVVYMSGKPMGGAFLLGHRDMLEIPWASTLRETNPFGINMLMYWAVLCRAMETGYSYFDLGRSSLDSGTYRFKTQWGAVPVPHRWHYWLPEGRSLPKLNPDNPRYRLLIAAWRRLPVAVTRWLGPPIVRNLP